MFEDWSNHCWCGISRVGVVAVDHNIAFGVDFAKHAADDVTFALFVFVADDGAGFLGDFSRIVGGIIVVNINRGFGKSFFEVSDDFLDSFSFVIAWDEDGNFIFFHGVSFG